MTAYVNRSPHSPKVMAHACIKGCTKYLSQPSIPGDVCSSDSLKMNRKLYQDLLISRISYNQNHNVWSEEDYIELTL